MWRATAIAAIACAALACTYDHHVELWLGSSATSISAGYECSKPGGGLLFSDAVLKEADGEHLIFAVVVDLIELGDGLEPMCLAEDIEGTCSANPCSNVQRECVSVDFLLDSDVTTTAETAMAIESWLDSNASQLLTNVTTKPVMVRVVAARATNGGAGSACAGIPATGFAGDEILGCAYSCVLQLQDVSTVQIGLDVQGELTDPTLCAEAIDECASFPMIP
jgi:hypothetical protein